jgi:hypothetical protein
MKTNTLVHKLLMAMSLVAVISLNSCRDEEDKISGDDVNNVNSESLSDSYFQDSDEMSQSAAERQDAAGGRVAAPDPRFDCATLTVTQGSTKTAGSIIVDFGDGCTKNGNTRKGKIKVTWSNGPAINIGFKTVTTFENYSINDIKLEGTRTVTKLQSSNITSLKYSAELVSGKATWPDASFITRASNFTAEVDFANLLDIKTTLTGSASGSNRREKEYMMEITSPIIFKGSCALSDGIYMAVQGTKSFTANGRQLIVDYGDGACDRSVTLTFGASSRTVNVEKK